MHFYILTLFPDMVMNGLTDSIIGRAMKNGYLKIEAVNIRDYAFNKHQSVDDYPYGGGEMCIRDRPETSASFASCFATDPFPPSDQGSGRREWNPEKHLYPERGDLSGDGNENNRWSVLIPEI